MTKSIQKALNGSVAVVINGETHYVTADKLLLGDKTLKEVLESIENDFKAQIKALQNEFDNKLMESEQQSKMLINSVNDKLEALQKHYNDTLIKLLSVGD